MIQLLEGSNIYPLMQEEEQKLAQREKGLHQSAHSLLQSLHENPPPTKSELRGRVSLSSSESEEKTVAEESDEEISTVSCTILHPKGFTYMGELRENQFHGKGRLDIKGTIYNGFFENHQFKKGVVTETDGGMLIGTFVGKQLHGVGQVRRVDGTTITGEFKEGALEKGVIQFPTGATMRGYFKNNMLNGVGQIIYSNKKEITGFFVDNKPVGKVNIKDGKGSRFEGEINGIGKLLQPNGFAYVGQFKNGLPEGEGDLIAPDGKRAQVTAKKGEITKK